MTRAVYKAAKGVIKIDLSLAGEKISYIRITGDFFLHPEEKLWSLEESLRGRSINEIDEIIRDFFKDVESPGVTAEDFIKAIRLATGERHE